MLPRQPRRRRITDYWKYRKGFPKELWKIERRMTYCTLYVHLYTRLFCLVLMTLVTKRYACIFYFFVYWYFLVLVYMVHVVMCMYSMTIYILTIILYKICIFKDNVYCGFIFFLLSIKIYGFYCVSYPEKWNFQQTKNYDNYLVYLNENYKYFNNSEVLLKVHYTISMKIDANKYL